ncbi:MAG TPA: EBSC protein [Treponema sp.]|nr:EBSC protein [Treponema sp.]
MSIETVRAYLAGYGYEEKIIELPESSATVALAAEALHTDPDQIAKTLAFEVGEHPIVVVVAGNRKIDNAKYRHRFSAKAKMISPDALVEKVGHAMGGVCPFAVRDGVEIYLDESLRDWNTVFPACGSGNSAIELSIPELEKLCPSAEWVDVSKKTGQ